MKSVVLFSGGLDSAVTAALAVACYGAPAVLLLHQPYGSRQQEPEGKAVARLAAHFGCEFLVVPHPWLGALGGSSLTGAGDLQGAATVVPGRNGLFLATAVAVAQARGARRVLIGAHASDHQDYPDCRREWLETQSLAARWAYGVEIEAPFVELTKAAVVQEGIRLGVPFELTYSCYAGTEPACEVCAACWERRQALAACGLATERSEQR